MSDLKEKLEHKIPFILNAMGEDSDLIVRILSKQSKTHIHMLRAATGDALLKNAETEAV